ncbi:MAG: EamA family transporter [Cytophagales bacterium]|nr:EamA family transporter [Cytophagales bacterium]
MTKKTASLELKQESLMKAALPWLLLAFLSLIWGSSFILMKKALQVYTPEEVASLRVIFAGGVLLPVTIRKFSSEYLKHAKPLLAVGLLGSLIPAFLFATAQQHIYSALAGVLNGLTPLFVILMGLWFFRARVTRNQFLGILIGFVGSALLIFAGSGGSLSGVNLYALLIVLATLCYGIQANILKYYLEGLRPLVITAFALGSVLPFAVGYLFGATDFATHFSAAGQEALTALGFLAILGIVGTAMALVLFNKLLQLAGPVFSSSVTYLIPIVAVIWGVWDGEILSVQHFAGMAVIFGGLLLVSKK